MTSSLLGTRYSRYKPLKRLIQYFPDREILEELPSWCAKSSNHQKSCTKAVKKIVRRLSGQCRPHIRWAITPWHPWLPRDWLTCPSMEVFDEFTILLITEDTQKKEDADRARERSTMTRADAETRCSTRFEKKQKEAAARPVARPVAPPVVLPIRDDEPERLVRQWLQIPKPPKVLHVCDA
jgi:hypothetical protein